MNTHYQVRVHITLYQGEGKIVAISLALDLIEPVPGWIEGDLAEQYQ